MRILAIALVLSVAAAAAGCRRQEQPAAPPASQDPMSALTQRLDTLAAEGATNEMITAMSRALWSADLAGKRSEILGRMLDLHARSGQIEAAQKLYLSVVARDPQSAAAAFGVIEPAMRGAGMTADLARWCESLLPTAVPDRVRETLFELLMECRQKLQEWEALLSTYDRCALTLPEADAARAVSWSLAALTEAGQYDRVQGALDFMTPRHGAKPAFANALTIAGVRLAVARKDVDKAASLLTAAADRLDDDDLSRALSWTTDAADKAGRGEIAEQLCSRILANRTPQSRLFGEVAGKWVQLAAKAGNLDEAVQRLISVSERRPPVIELLKMTSEVIYTVMDKGGEQAKLKVLDLCGRLVSATDSDADKAAAATLMLDACFMTASFDTALKVLEGRVPGRDETWHKMLIVKVKAHKALQEKRVEDAIGYFREFMSYVTASPEAMIDPTTGLRVSTDSILGFNAVRIGDLWKSVGKLEQARAAYEEARGCYRKALEAAGPGSPERESLLKSLESVPEVAAGNG